MYINQYHKQYHNQDIIISSFMDSLFFSHRQVMLMNSDGLPPLSLPYISPFSIQVQHISAKPKVAEALPIVWSAEEEVLPKMEFNVRCISPQDGASLHCLSFWAIFTFTILT